MACYPLLTIKLFNEQHSDHHWAPTACPRTGEEVMSENDPGKARVLKLELTPQQVAELKPLLDPNTDVKAIYVRSSLEKGKMVLSYIACNGPPDGW